MGKKGEEIERERERERGREGERESERARERERESESESSATLFVQLIIHSINGTIQSPFKNVCVCACSPTQTHCAYLRGECEGGVCACARTCVYACVHACDPVKERQASR